MSRLSCKRGTLLQPHHCDQGQRNYVRKSVYILPMHLSMHAYMHAFIHSLMYPAIHASTHPRIHHLYIYIHLRILQKVLRKRKGDSGFPCQPLPSDLETLPESPVDEEPNILPLLDTPLYSERQP